jgi:guanylate kinase
MSLKILGNLKRGLVFIVSAPAGTGKTTLVQMLAKEFDCVASSVSMTTREPRQGEVQGVDYDFLTRKEFEEKITAGDFLEYVELYGHYYGTSKKKVEELRNRGKHVILTIDTQGARQLMDKFDAVYIFVSPPSFEELRKRLFSRKTETSEVINERLEWAKKELEIVSLYDYNIVNDNLSVAYEALRSILIAEEHRVVSPTEKPL